MVSVAYRALVALPLLAAFVFLFSQICFKISSSLASKGSSNKL